MPSYRPESHKTLVALLVEHRKAAKLSYRKIASRLPAWMGFQFTTVQKVFEEQRDVSYAELREIARVLSTSVAALDLRVDEVLAAKARAEVAPSLARKPRKRQTRVKRHP